MFVLLISVDVKFLNNVQKKNIVARTVNQISWYLNNKFKIDHQRDIVKDEIYRHSLFNINYRCLQTIILVARFTVISSVSHRTSQRRQHVLIIKTNYCDISSYLYVKCSIYNYFFSLASYLTENTACLNYKTPMIATYILIMKANEMHNFPNLFDKVLYMFRAGPLSIIRSMSTLYTRNRYLSCHFCWRLWIL